MDAKQNAEPVLNTVDLMSAVLCADCEVISDSSGEVCAVCGSRSLLSLGRVLGGSIGDERATVIPAEERELRNMFTLLDYQKLSNFRIAARDQPQRGRSRAARRRARTAGSLIRTDIPAVVPVGQERDSSGWAPTFVPQSWDSSICK